MGLYEYDDTCDVSNARIIEELVQIVPVRWDGIQEQYVVCAENERSHQLISYKDSDNLPRAILLANSANRDIIVDLL